LIGLDAISGLSRLELETVSRELACPAYIGDHVGICRVLAKYKIYVDTRDVALAPHVLLDGFWESWITQFVARRVRPGWTAIDVGANCGYFTLLMADLVGPHGHVIAVEPNPAMTPLLRRSVALNGFAERTTICEVAAGAADDGFTTLIVPDRSPGQSAMVSDASAPWDNCTKVAVPTATLDGLVSPGQRVDFIKIDAEGSEERILNGMNAMVEAYKPDLLLEFHPGRYRQPETFLCYLFELYGSLCEINGDGKPVAVEPERVLSEQTEWMLFLGAR
jgi:FkbM family methyltransferase